MTDHTNPTVEQFLASPEPDEDDTPHAPMWHSHNPAGSDAFVAAESISPFPPGTIWTLPPDPMERIASALERMAGVETFTVELNSTDEVPSIDGRDEILQATHEALADLEAKHQTLTQVISDVEAALGKSTAKPAMAARAVIDEWRNPQVPKTKTGDHAVDWQQAAAANPDMLPGHTRAETGEDTPDICQECSYAAQDYAEWPCEPVRQAFAPLGVEKPEDAIFVPETAVKAPLEVIHPPVQPEHNAPVEEWRSYARALGYAGPDIDKASRSVIRTTLGIAQPVSEGGGA